MKLEFQRGVERKENRIWGFLIFNKQSFNQKQLRFSDSRERTQKMCIEQRIQEIAQNQNTIFYFIEPGLSSYKNIMQLYSQRNNDDLLRYLFYDFYSIQGLSHEKREKCFKYFLNNTGESKEDFYNGIRKITGRNELSLATKLFHTANPKDGIIIDSHVCNFCGRKGEKHDFQLWSNIQNDFIQNGFNRLENFFNNLFPDDRGISPCKKIDFMIWGWGKWKKWKKKEH